MKRQKIVMAVYAVMPFHLWCDLKLNKGSPDER
jgi:hypothetical protein